MQDTEKDAQEGTPEGIWFNLEPQQQQQQEIRQALQAARDILQQQLQGDLEKLAVARERLERVLKGGA